MNYYEVSFVIRPLLPGREVLVAELADLPFESFVETSDGVKAYIPEPDYRDDLLDGLMAFQIEDTSITHTTVLIQDENWNAKWESSFDPILVGDRMIIRAPFHSCPEGIEFDIIIEPKMSFGTGHHATTFLVAQAMLDMTWNNKTVLDMGSGTGVLAILAEKMGASKVDAIDIDSWAYENIQENNERNHTHLNMWMGGAELLTEADVYDAVLANINRNILTRDMAFYSRSMKKNAVILFSGFYVQDAPEIEQSANACGLYLQSQHAKDNWNMMVFIKQ